MNLNKGFGLTLATRSVEVLAKPREGADKRAIEDLANTPQKAAFHTN